MSKEKKNDQKVIIKREEIELMFDHIAELYDMMNHVMTLNLDKRWRRTAITLLESYNPSVILDIATGTADMAIDMVNKMSDKVKKIVATDISEEMLEIGKHKIDKLNLGNIIEFKKEDCHSLNFDNGSFDCATISFGIRNFENIPLALKEIYRVLNERGTLMILELCIPTKKIWQGLYNIYAGHVIPRIGKYIASSKEAYTYLPASIRQFPKREVFIKMLQEAGFRDAYYQDLTFGVAAIYIAVK